MDQRIITYQDALRAIGASLDEVDARSYAILEIPDGFAVCYSPDVASYPSSVEYVRSEDLRALYETDLEHRGSALGPAGEIQDFLRALGHDLDQAAAYSALVEEAGDSILVSYEYLFFDAQGNDLVRKRHFVLSPKQKAELLQKAHGRRSPEAAKPSGGLFGRFGSRRGSGS